MDIEIITKFSKENENIKITIEASKMTEKVEQIIGIVSSVTNETKQIIGTKDNLLYVIPTKEIMSFYSEQKSNYCKTKNGNFKIKEKLYELEEMLSNNFVRISNSCIINLNYVECFDANFTGTVEVILKDNSKEYISRRRVNEVMRKIKERRD